VVFLRSARATWARGAPCAGQPPSRRPLRAVADRQASCGARGGHGPADTVRAPSAAAPGAPRRDL